MDLGVRLKDHHPVVEGIAQVLTKPPLAAIVRFWFFGLGLGDLDGQEAFSSGVPKMKSGIWPPRREEKTKKRGKNSLFDQARMENQGNKWSLSPHNPPVSEKGRPRAGSELPLI